MYSNFINIILDLLILASISLFIWLLSRHDPEFKKFGIVLPVGTIQIISGITGLFFLWDLLVLFGVSSDSQSSDMVWYRLQTLIVIFIISTGLIVLLKKLQGDIEQNIIDLEESQQSLKQELRQREQLEKVINAQYLYETQELHYELSIQREFIDAFFDSAPSGLTILDNKYRILKANKTFLTVTQLQHRKLVGQPVTNVLSDLDDNLSTLLKKAANSHTAQSIDTTFHLEGKNPRRMTATCFPISVEPESKKPGFGLILTDIEEQRRLEERLRQAQKLEAVGRLAGGVAHDFNNLLMVIQFASDRLMNIVGDDAKAIVELRDIVKAAENASALTRQLLAFSRMQVLEPKVVNLPKAIDNVRNLLERTLGDHIRVEIEGNEDAAVHVDPVQLDLIVLNLSINARDAMKNGGVLSISCDTRELKHNDIHEGEPVLPGRYAVLTVADTGEGMDQNTIELIFEPFYTTKGRHEGTGLGLATVHGIIAQSGGMIRVRSELSKGSTFEVFFPLVDSSKLVKDKESELPYISNQEMLQKTILLVEDEPAVLKLMYKTLEESGYHVVTAANSKEGLKLARDLADDLDMLVTDVVMPGISGLDLANRITSEIPALPILMVSGYTADHAEIRQIAELPYYFMQKPFQPDDLINKVNEILVTAAEEKIRA